MQIGSPSAFAIECVHEPVPNTSRSVFGRMCIWLHGERVGDFDEPMCMLNVTAAQLHETLRRLPELEEPAFTHLSDAEVFRVLDDALYRGDVRTSEQIVADSAKYWKFDFLTNGGESFDKTKSFICSEGASVRVLFEQFEGNSSHMISGKVSSVEFSNTVSEFLRWIDGEGVKHAG